jgi:hypothetical protein
LGDLSECGPEKEKEKMKYLVEITYSGKTTKEIEAPSPESAAQQIYPIDLRSKKFYKEFDDSFFVEHMEIVDPDTKIILHEIFW